MKKILIAVAAVMLFGANAYADSITATVDGNEIRITQAETMSQRLIAACYDGDGMLTYAGAIEANEGEYVITLPDGYEAIKLYDLGVNSYDVELITATAAPEITQEPEPTLHPAYEKEVDAVSAFAVVEKVATTINANNEECYAITCLYQGQKITVEVAEDTQIKSAPDAFSYLEGEAAVSLKTGDVIYIETNVSQTKIRGLYLIYRPANVFEGGSFYNYFTDSNKAGGLWSVVPYGAKAPSDRYTYAFGVVAEKYDDTLVLYSHSGLSDDAIDIDITSDTVTYLCDMEGKPELEIARPSGIKKSKISKAGIDEDDNITYSDDYTYSLALVRLVDDTAADIVVYQNIEF